MTPSDSDCIPLKKVTTIPSVGLPSGDSTPATLGTSTSAKSGSRGPSRSAAVPRRLPRSSGRRTALGENCPACSPGELRGDRASRADDDVSREDQRIRANSAESERQAADGRRQKRGAAGTIGGDQLDARRGHWFATSASSSLKPLSRAGSQYAEVWSSTSATSLRSAEAVRKPLGSTVAGSSRRRTRTPPNWSVGCRRARRGSRRARSAPASPSRPASSASRPHQLKTKVSVMLDLIRRNDPRAGSTRTSPIYPTSTTNSRPTTSSSASRPASASLRLSAPSPAP